LALGLDNQLAASFSADNQDESRRENDYLKSQINTMNK